MKYLVVDDHAPCRQLIRDFLPKGDVEVVECSNGTEAVNVFDAELPDWVLMDIELPGMDGLTALRAIRLKHPNARIAIVTQYDSDFLREDAAEAGATAFISKDDLTQLRALLEQYRP